MQKKFVPVKFPRDESVHDMVTEWWYFNGHLSDAHGKKYSYMDCLFRVDVKRVNIPFLSKVPLKTSYFSHSLITDMHNRTFHERIAPFSIVSDDSFSKPLLYVNYINPEFKNGYTNCIIEKTGAKTYHIKNEDIDLNFIAVKRPILEGGHGFIDLHTKSTYYYSLTNLKTEGRIKSGNKWVKVTGKSWMDHQWSDSGYVKDRWDWFSIQLDNNTEMVCCMYDNGREKTFFADVSLPDDSHEHFHRVEIVPLAKRWASPVSNAVYPLEWNIRIPSKKIDLRLTAGAKNQEMLFGQINYWEGPLSVSGLFNGKKAKGVGFMELVGYPSEYTNVRYVRDEVGKLASWLVSKAKNTTLSLTHDLKRKMVG